MVDMIWLLYIYINYYIQPTYGGMGKCDEHYILFDTRV